MAPRILDNRSLASRAMPTPSNSSRPRHLGSRWSKVHQPLAVFIVGILALLGLKSLFFPQIRYISAASEQKSLLTAAKYAQCHQPQVYSESSPRLTAIVQSFNHAMNIANISDSLVSSKHVEEIVICEDGSSDSSLTDWSAALTGSKHFVIRSNNLHEMRSYNRAMRLSDGEVILLLQDDDLLPLDDVWIKDALDLLNLHPDIGILGGYIGQLWDPDTGMGYEFGEQISSHGGVRKGKTKPIPYIDPKSNLPFMFVECAWNAPLFVRRSLIKVAGGLNLDITKQGEPGVWQDCVYAYEAWDKGFSVAVFDAPFVRGVGGHGSASSPAKLKLRDKVWKRAVGITKKLYNRRKTHNMAKKRNEEQLLKRDLR